MTFPALLDTCVLYPAYLCDTLLRLAEAEAYRPLWSADILIELKRNVVEAGIPADRVDRRIAQMSHSFPDAMVTGYDSLIDGMTNDPKDRHILAGVCGEFGVVEDGVRDIGRSGSSGTLPAGHKGQGLMGERRPRNLGAGVQAEPLFHRLALPRVEMHTLTGGDQRINPRFRQLHNQASVCQHGEDLAAET